MTKTLSKTEKATKQPKANLYMLIKIEVDDDKFPKKVFEIAFGNDAIKKDYTRDDVLERLMEFSNKSLKLEELEDAK